MIEGQEVSFKLCALAKVLGDRGWLPATSGNLSAMITREPLAFVVTRSGADKQRLAGEDLLTVGPDAQLLEPSAQGYRPSAEASVHGKIYEKLHCGAILHVHTLYNNLCSQLFWADRTMVITDHELLKALGHWEADATIGVAIVDNHHDLDDLARAVGAAAQADVPGVLVRSHGIYVWGDDLEAAFRHLEAFEFLFAYEILRRSVVPQSPLRVKRGASEDRREWPPVNDAKTVQCAGHGDVE